MPFLDFAAIKAAVNIEDAAQLLGLRLTKAGHQLRAPCPACKSGGDRALVITPAKGLFFCFPGEKGGDVLALAAHIRGCSVKDAAEFLAERYMSRTSEEYGTGTVRKERANEPQDQEGRSQPAAAGMAPLDYLDADHPAVEAAGFSAEEAKQLGIGWASKGLMRGTVAVPIRDAHGTLLGYIGVQEAKLPPKGLLGLANVVSLQAKRSA